MAAVAEHPVETTTDIMVITPRPLGPVVVRALVAATEVMAVLPGVFSLVLQKVPREVVGGLYLSAVVLEKVAGLRLHRSLKRGKNGTPKTPWTFFATPCCRL
jgi:hypothetical protein